MAAIVEKVKREVQQQAEAQDQVQEIDIEDIKIEKFTPELASIFNKYPNLITVGFASCDLATLEGFPKFVNLENLLLEENKLDGKSLNYIASNFKNLVSLSLAFNDIKSFEEVENLKGLKLEQLDLSENPISKLEGYPSKIFQIIPTLQILDNKDRDGVSIQYDDDEQFNRILDELSDENDDEDNDDDDDEDDNSEVGQIQKKRKM